MSTDNNADVRPPVDSTAWNPQDAEPAVKPPAPPPEAPAPDKDPGGEQFMQGLRKLATFLQKAALGLFNKTRQLLTDERMDPRVSIKMIDRMIAWSRSSFPPEKYDKLARSMAHYGHIALVLSQIVALVFFLLAALRMNNWVYIFYGPAAVLVLAILQYTAEKFMNAGNTLIQSSPSRLSSAAFLDCLALLMKVTGVILFVAFLAQRQWSFFFVGLGILALCSCIAYIALHPAMANIEVSEQAAAGEEAIGILSFLVKAMVRIVPMAFGIAAITGLLALLASCFAMLFHREVSGVYAAMNMVAAGACLPFISYIIFTLYHLTIDVLRAILVLPGKIDRLRKGPESSQDA